MTLDYREEIERLAGLPLDEFGVELTKSAQGLKGIIGKGDLRKAVERRRREREQAARGAERGGTQQDSMFDIGSNVEIAKNFAKVLKDQFTLGIVYGEGNFWYYGDTDWKKIDPVHIHKLIYRYDGSTFRAGQSVGVIRLDTKKIESILKETSVLLYQPQFFALSPVGINCLSGFIVFDEHGVPSLLPHNPDHRVRHTIQARWAEGVKVDLAGSLLAKALHTLFQYVPCCEEYKGLIQELVGVVFTAYATKLKQPKCIILVGERANNGKSTLIAVLRGAVPEHAVSSIPAKSFHKQEYAVQLAGKALNTSDELSVHALESDVFKQLIDGKNEFSARGLYKDVVTFKPRALHVFSTQHAPKFIGGIDSGVQRRTVIINFPVSIAEEDMIENLEEKILENEMDLLLAWGIEGASRVMQQRNYTLPADAKEAVEAWVEDNDTVEQWLKHRVRLHPASPFAYTPFGFFKHYRDWCRMWEHSKPLEKTAFYRRVMAKFPHLELDRKRDTRKTITGLVLLNDDDGDAAERVIDEQTGGMVVNNTTTVWTKH